MATATYLKAIEAGVDIVDCAISSLASGTSQPPTETLVNTLRDTKYDTGLDIKLLAEIASYFRDVRAKYSKFESKYTGVDPDVLVYQIPGGMTSNLASQLNEQKALQRMPEGFGRGSPRKGGLWLSSSGYAFKPDSRHTGNIECFNRRKIQGYYKRDKELSKGLVWKASSAYK